MPERYQVFRDSFTPRRCHASTTRQLAAPGIEPERYISPVLTGHAIQALRRETLACIVVPDSPGFYFDTSTRSAQGNMHTVQVPSTRRRNRTL